MKTPGSIPPSGPHGICSTFWTWGISQTSPGHQSPVDILTWPKGCPLCPGGRRPRTPKHSQTQAHCQTRATHDGRRQYPKRPGARPQAHLATGGLSAAPHAPPPPVLVAVPTRGVQRVRRRQGVQPTPQPPSCKPRELASTSKSGESPTTSTTTPNSPSQPSEDFTAPHQAPVEGGSSALSRESAWWYLLPQLSFSPRPQSDCAASSGGREPWTWRGRASLAVGPGALCLAAPLTWPLGWPSAPAVQLPAGPLPFQVDWPRPA